MLFYNVSSGPGSARSGKLSVTGMLLAWFKFLPNLFPLSIIWHLTWGTEKYSPIPGINNGLFGKLQWHILNLNFFLSPIQFQDTFVIIKVSTTLWTRHKKFGALSKHTTHLDKFSKFCEHHSFYPFFSPCLHFLSFIIFCFFLISLSSAHRANLWLCPSFAVFLIPKENYSFR